MIYLIRSYGIKGKSVLKIGFTDDFERRMDQYFYSNPMFQIVSIREGDEMLENLFHRYLYFLGFQYKNNGKLDEWFLDVPEIYQIFHLSQETVEKLVWRNRNEIFNIKSGSSADYTMFEYLYYKHMKGFKGTRYENIGNKIYKTKAKEIDISFWKFYIKNREKSRFKEEDINIIVSDFLDNYFYKSGIFESKMKLYCEFCDQYKDNSEIMATLDHKIDDLKYKGYYTFYGTEGCSAKSYKEVNLLRGWQNSTLDSRLETMIRTKFKVGGRYTMKDIKAILSGLYSHLGISKTAKAKDLENYFKLSKTKITMPDKSLENGFKLGIL